MKTKVLVVAGPTASGKTGLGIALARRLDGEIVCADSMQIYTGMPIATAAPTAAERQAAVHHLAEILPPDTPFSVAQYCNLAAETVADIAARGKVPILVGGTGLFIDSFIDHIQFAHVQTNPDLRRELLAKDGAELYRTLQQVDPTAAAEIHPNNKNRVVRALELYYAGITKTAQNAASRREDSPYEALYFVLRYRDRQVLYDRINARVDAMLAAPKDTPGPCRSTVPMVGDVRLFVNTLQHAVDLMTQRGIPAVTSCEQADGFLEYTVRIPTATPAPLPVPNTLPACHEPEMPSGEGSSLGEEDELVRS